MKLKDEFRLRRAQSGVPKNYFITKIDLSELGSENILM